MYEDATVRRVLPGLGVVFGLPAGAAGHTSAGFAHVSQLSDTRIDKIEKVRRSDAQRPELLLPDLSILHCTNPSPILNHLMDLELYGAQVDAQDVVRQTCFTRLH